MDLNRSSYSELNTVASCERRWAYKYLWRTEFEQPKSWARGTNIHEVVGEWWDHPELSMAQILGELPHSEDPEELDLLVWLALRYEQFHSDDRAGSVRVVGRELKFEQKLPGTEVTIVSYIDQLDSVDGKLVPVERKSMANWEILDEITLVGAQPSIYLWQLRRWVDVEMMKVDAIRTYRWKPERPTQKELLPAIEAEHPDWTKKAMGEEAKRQVEAHPGVERPVEESFRVEWLDRTDRQIEETHEDMRAALQRRMQLAAGAPPTRNIGPMCKRCPFKGRCWDELAFGEEEEIELVD